MKTQRESFEECGRSINEIREGIKKGELEIVSSYLGDSEAIHKMLRTSHTIKAGFSVEETLLIIGCIRVQVDLAKQQLADFGPETCADLTYLPVLEHLHDKLVVSKDLIMNEMQAAFERNYPPRLMVRRTNKIENQELGDLRDRELPSEGNGV